jgi:hypothetical protein
MDWLTFFRVAGYVAIFLGVICTVGVDIIKTKQEKKREELASSSLNELKDDVKKANKALEPFSDIALKLYPSLDQKNALEKLRQRLDIIDQEISNSKGLINDLNKEKNTIKTFEALVKVTFTGKWLGMPYPQSLESPACTPYLFWVDNSTKRPTIEFCSTKIKFETINASEAVFANTLSVQPGSMPLGSLIDVLGKYDEMVVSFPLIWRKRLIDSSINIKHIKITFLINGSEWGKFNEEKLIVVDLKEPLNKAKNDEFIVPEIAFYGNIASTIRSASNKQ